MQITKKERRQRRAIKTRMKIRELGVARLTVHRTPQHIYAQVFDSSGGKVLGLTLGFSHAVNFPIPDGISMETPSQTEIIIKGIDRQKIGQVAAKIRAIRPPEPYKGKGVRYSGEQITLKEGKKK